ncbi:tRNA-dependent cyclodipeptide synthase [Streptomyces sp. H10-C2]|uniref:tRNA-dependent cyclodipeptide synthase n=1 Tax=unclassified Streptomyces TaxID=2593676 RepID=UPI0024BB4A6E|nr:MULTISPECIES: tRNA-dependent cyclodipeptide synthase [unclassified Streptomyces]MDJ0340108.1 tRNA-dependent cyclodipeptide synthase [Streptomyces sp. PH10-H1]MDJ0369255.1 tRNA-dependent cyclodipeptide synthase [Streptomyces sp. H10-C2]
MSQSTAMSTTAGFEVIPFTDECRTIWDHGEHLLIGVSPGNSYFTHQRIRELASWADRRFSAIDIVYADLHIDAMFAAFGYTAEHAGKRASKELKAVRRRILRGVDEAGPLTARLRVRGLSEFTGDPQYRRLHAEAEAALEHDDEFGAACEEMVRQFLAPKIGESAEITDGQRGACLRYIAAELPFFVDTPAIVNAESSVSSYHAEMPLTKVLFARGSGFRATANQAYAVIRPHQEEENHR